MLSWKGTHQGHGVQLLLDLFPCKGCLCDARGEQIIVGRRIVVRLLEPQNQCDTSDYTNQYYSTSASSLQMKPSICILMTVFSLRINCESRENKDAQVDRRLDLAPSYVAIVVFDVRQVTFSLLHPLQNYLWLVRMSSFCL